MPTPMRLLLPPYDTIAAQDSAPQEVCMHRWAAADHQPAADRQPAARAPPAADAMDFDDAYAPSDVQKKTKGARPHKKVRIAALPYAKPKSTPGAVAHPADAALRIQGPAPKTKPDGNTKPSQNGNCNIFKITGIPCPQPCSGATSLSPVEARITSCAADHLRPVEAKLTSHGGGDEDYIALVRTHIASAVDSLTLRARQFDSSFRGYAAAADVLGANSPAPMTVTASKLHDYLRTSKLWSDQCYRSMRRSLQKYLKYLEGSLSDTGGIKGREKREVRLAAVMAKFTKAIESRVKNELSNLHTSVEALDRRLKKSQQNTGHTAVDTTVPDMIAVFDALRMHA